MSGLVRAKPSFFRLGAVLILAGAASWAQAIDKASDKTTAKAPANKVLTIGDLAVSLAWSSNWIFEGAAAKGMPGTIEFHAPDRLQMVTLLTPLGGTPGLNSDEAMKEVVTKSSRQFESQAVEKEIKLQRISSGEAHGYFVCLTDKAPKAGEYKFLCQGLLSLRELPINFTVLYNDGGKADAERVLSALKTIEAAKQT